MLHACFTDVTCTINVSSKSDHPLSLQAEKLLVRNLPFPYTSKDVYEQSIRMPIGPDFNPAISVAALNRPAVSTV